MLKIGDISKICGITVKTMRFYEKQGLIHPVLVDRWTGYRYYDDSSVVKTFQIIYLKSLGFTLKEIKNFDRETIENKTVEIQTNINKFKKSIKTLQSFLKIEKGEDIMKKVFINDEKVIGKWSKIAIVDSIEEFNAFSKNDNQIFPYENIYFLPKGEEYWVFSWTKGKVIVNNYDHPYVIKNDLMFIGVRDGQTGVIDKYAVYKKIDNNKYSPDDIRIEDNLDIPFVDDPDVVGLWNRVDLVRNIEDFDPQKERWGGEQILKAYTFNHKGEVFVEYMDGFIKKNKWSKGVVLDSNVKTASAYVIKEINGRKYLFVEWKSGDYVFGGKVEVLYVFEKI